jgi:recombination protein RecT
MTNNEVATVNERAVGLRQFLHRDHIKSQLEMALPKWLSVDRLLRIVFSSAVRNPRLLQCTQESILQSVMMCAQLGLEPILGRAYLIPYNNSKYLNGGWKKVMECQFQPGYQGLVDLARRSGTIQDVWGHVVHERDEFDLELGTNRRIHFKPCMKDEPGDAIGAFAIWALEGGLFHPEFMPVVEINKRRDRSQAWQNAQKKPDDKNAQDTPWIQWPDEMRLKTVVKHSSKLVPASIEFMEAVAVDDAAETGRRYVSPFMDAMNQIPEKTAADLEAEFNDLAGREVPAESREAFDQFLSDVAAKNGLSVQVAKADVMRENDFANLMAAFRKKSSISEPSASGTGGNAQGQGSGSEGPGSGGGDGSGTGGEVPENHPFARKNWIGKKKAGLKSYVDKHFGRLSEMTMEAFNELAEKWKTIYGEPFPYDPDGALINPQGQSGSPEGDGKGDPEKGGKSGSQQGESTEEILNSREAMELAQLARKYPASYSQVVQNRTPESIAQAKEWIQKIDEAVAFTGEQAQE